MTDSLFSIAGKRILLSGGAAGIGRMLTDGLAERGAKIFTVSRKKDALDAMASELSGRGFKVGTSAADLSEMADVERIAKEAGDYFGGAIDVLINNAGATWGAVLGEYPMSGWDKVFDLNVKGLFHLTQCCLPYLRKAAAEHSGDPARVINIGSISGLGQPGDNAWAYHPAKAAVHHLTRNMAKTLAAESITVNAIAPGLFPSKMTKHLMPGGDTDGIGGAIPLGRVGSPEDIVGTVVYLASRAGAFNTGALITVDGGSAL